MKIHRRPTTLALAGLLIWVLALGTTPARAAQALEALHGTTSLPGSAALAAPGEPQEMEAFLDEFFEAQMAELHIPGAAIVVVQDGKVLLSKGYGYADLERRIPVDPAKTAFRAGSISKLLTWTAVMQVAERGLLDLDAGVNRYPTTFQIPDTYPQPVTAGHLATHTAGFEDRWVGTKTYDPAELEPLDRALARLLPERVEAPGVVHSYSNYGANLAGHLVELVSGLSFDQYVEENILQPLDMDGTTFRQPLPEALAASIATGYTYKDGVLQPAPLAYARMAPATALTVTPIDMAAFMIAHLHEGAYGPVRILQPETAREMRRQQFTHHPDMPGMTFGFKERFVNGRRIIGHGGDFQTFAAQLILIPEEDLGFFVAYNRFDDAFREQLITAFLDYQNPAATAAPAPQAIETPPDSLDRFAGRYRWVKYPRSAIGKAIALVPGPYPIVIEVNDDNSLSLSFFGAKPEWRYVPVGPLLFGKVEGGPQLLAGLLIDPGDMLAFQENEVGEIAYGSVSLQNTAFERLSWYESPEAQLGTMGALLLLFASAVVLLPLGGLIGRRRRRSETHRPGSRLGLWVGWGVSALSLAFLCLMFLSFGEELVYGVPLAMRLLLLVPFVSGALSIVFLIVAAYAWIRGIWPFVGRLYYSLIAVSAVVFLLFCAYWNMLGWRF